jgi:hypothetical protein
MKNVVPGFEVLWRANTLTLAQCHSYQRGFGTVQCIALLALKLFVQCLSVIVGVKG